jgi:hypothetical protein
MKFRLSNLLMLTVLVGVILTSALFIRKEREINEEKMQQVKAGAEELLKHGEDAVASAIYYKRELGVFDGEISDRSKPFIKSVRIPKELGGLQLYGLPFTWRWRLYLPDINEFEVCCAINDVPKSGFALPADSIFTSFPDLSKGSKSGIGYSGEDSKPIDPAKPVEIFLTVRLDGEDETGTIHICYQIEQEGNQVDRTDHIRFKIDDGHWLGDSSLSAASYEIGGISIEHPYEIPLLSTRFSCEAPLTLLRIRSQRHVEGLKYEPIDGPTTGLMVWLQKHSPVSEPNHAMPDAIPQPSLKPNSGK